MKHTRKLLAVVSVLMMVSGMAAGQVTENRFMTGDSQQTNGLSAFYLDTAQTDNAQSGFAEEGQGGLEVNWGTRLFVLEEDGSTEEITPGTPVAQVERTAEAEGIQSNTYSMPQIDVGTNDALVSRVYIDVGGNGFTEVAEHTTESLGASEISGSELEIFYYTEYETADTGPPGGRFTRGTFYWGDQTFNSRIENVQYEEASVDAVQTVPDGDLDTYPGQEFEHTVEVTCDADSCENVEITPQAQQSGGTGFQDVSELTDFGLNWEQESLTIDNIDGGDTVEESITVTAEDEGEYDIRFQVEADDIQGDITEDGLVDVHVSNPELTDFTHENLDEAGINEYEAGDTISFIDTEITAFDGQAFNLTVSPRIDDSDGVETGWGPDETKGFVDLAEGAFLTRSFEDYQIPATEDEGVYTFRIDFDWENFGPDTNEDNTFQIVNLRENFESILQDDSVFQGENTEYEFQFENRWSEDITDVQVNINCPGDFDCQPVNTNTFTSVAPGEIETVNFEVETFDSTETGEYDINTTIQYENPNDVRVWEEVENEDLQVSSDDALLADIMDEDSGLEDTVTRGDLQELRGSVTNPAEPAEGVTLEWLLPDGWDVTEGEVLKEIGELDTDEVDYNNITSEITIFADRGEHEIVLESDNQDGDRGETTSETVEVFGQTDTDLVLNTTNAAHGQEVEADIDLNLDTGASLESQRIVLRNIDEGETLDAGETDSSGELTLSFEVEEDWEVGDNSIVAEYGQNDTIYTRGSQDTTELQVSDFPEFVSVDENPVPVGMGYPVDILTEVNAEDGIQTVEALVENPSGETEEFELREISDSNFELQFNDTRDNGVYSYNLTATSEEGFQTRSTGHEFEARGNATKTVVSDKDVYGPYEEVSLDRILEVVSERDTLYSTLTRDVTFIPEFSEEFSTFSGTSTFHTNTHEEDGELFEMTEQSGSPPDTPDEFDGVYTYEVDVDPTNMELESLGFVDEGADFSVQVRNYETSEWEELFSVAETTPTRFNGVICTTAAECEDFVQNDEVEIRVFSATDRDTEEYTYSVDYQELKIETQGEEYEKDDEPDQIQVGDTGESINRHYSTYDLENLPIPETASIESARLLFNATEQSDGEIHWVELQDQETEAEQIHLSDQPSESDQNNPVADFTSETQTEQQIDVTQAVETSYQERKNIAFQWRAMDETDSTESLNLEEQPILEVNYTSDSQMTNTGDLDIQGFLDMRVQRLENGEWETVGFPQVTPSAGTYPVDSSEQLDLNQIWHDNGGFNTLSREEGTYRVQSTYVDEDSEPMETDQGEPITDTYEFRIEGAELNLTELIHSNQFNYGINEFETTDDIEFIDITIENNQSTAANATANLNVLDDLSQRVEWGPNSMKEFGDIEAGAQETRRWDNDETGYSIPEDASSGTFEFTWNTTLNADNFEREEDYSFGFILHHVPDGFDSLIEAEQNRVFRNESTVYEFTVSNPWSQPLEQVEVTINCDDEQLGCEGLDSGTSAETIGQLGASKDQTVGFNLTTDENTDVDDFDINATLNYTNPSQEEKTWVEQMNEVLRVRIPGSLINVTESPERVTRGQDGYRFESYTNNTFDEDLTNVSTTWVIPEDWNNQSGTLEEFRDVQETGELIYNNFTAEIEPDAGLGEKEIQKQARNDQGREDDFILNIEVFANTVLDIEVNDTTPAVNDTIEISGQLTYDNGTALESELVTVTDEETGEVILEEVTDENGEYTGNYEVPNPEGERTLTVEYEGSNEKYANSQTSEQIIEVTGTPEIIRLEEDPQVQGFGKDIVLEAELDGEEEIENVDATVERPDGTTFTEEMTEVDPDIYQVEVSSFQNGQHTYAVEATNEADNSDTATSTFVIEVGELSTIQTQQDDYLPNDQVELTTKDGSWWDTEWEFRQRIQAEEISGNDLERYPSLIEIEGLGDNTDSCEDIRVIQDLEVQDIFIEDCNPEGTTQISAEVDLPASESREDIFVYYGNENAESVSNEAYAYRIEDSGTSSSSTSLNQEDIYNDGEAIFRQIDITVFGDDLQASVDAYNYETEEYETLFEGNPADGENIISELYYQNPRYSELVINLEDTSNNPGEVSYEYDYNTPENIDTEIIREDEKLPSLIENTGETEFEGRINLTVQEEVNGGWETETQIALDEETQDITTENLGEIWNQEGWVTEKTGNYRAYFELIGPEGNTLQSPEGPIKAAYEFTVNPPPTQVEVEEIQIYNVTASGDQQDDTTDLVESGLNETLRVPEDETYRFDVSVINDESAESEWEITSEDIIEYLGFDPDWNVDADTGIFYENETQRYEGGSFDGDVQWDTQGGTVQPGDSSRFAFVVDIPEGEVERDIEFIINDATFTEQDSSVLNIVELDDVPPETEFFNINDTLRRGEDLVATAGWSKDIDESDAEYDIIEPGLLTNSTVEPEGEYTNTTIGTDGDWFRGEHQFQFYATDFSGNTNTTETAFFDVFATAEIDQFEVDPLQPETGEDVVLECRITDGNNDAISGYEVEFYDKNLIEQTSTNATGWANTTYSSEEVGEQELFCAIFDDEEEFYLTSGEDSFEEEGQQIFIGDPEAPDYQDFGSNLTRIFKTDDNSTGYFFSEWADTSELDSSSLTFGDFSAGSGDLPESPFDIQSLSGEDDIAEFEIQVPEETEPKNTTWNIHANDTTGNINSTGDIDVDIWAWSFFDSDESGLEDNPILNGTEADLQCRVVRGNDQGIEGYDVEFYDNETGTRELVETGQTASDGTVNFTKVYEETGNYQVECDIDDRPGENIEVFEGEEEFTEVLSVQEQLTAPEIVDNNYFIESSRVFIEEDVQATFAQWDTEIEQAWLNYNFSESSGIVEKEIEGPYDNNWTNSTLQPNSTWDVGEYGVQTVAESTEGGVNDNEEFLIYEVFSRSVVEWTEPLDEATVGEEEFVCRVTDENTGDSVADYTVEFFDEEPSLIGTNETNEEGYSRLTVDTSDRTAGEEVEYSCRINDEEELYYNTGSQDSDTEILAFGDEMETEILNPENGTVVEAGEVIDLESFSTDSSGNQITPENVTWFQDGEEVAQGENTTYEVDGGSGLAEISVEAEEEDFATGEDSIFIEIEGDDGILVGEITSPENNTKVAQNRTFTANVSVTCQEQDCGEVTTGIRYNQTGDTADTLISEIEDEPFFTEGSNPNTCTASLSVDETCYSVWEVNATGDKGSVHALDVEMDGETAQVNTTEDIHVGIEEILILDVNYNALDFGSGGPGDRIDASRNEEDEYIAQLSENSNTADAGLWGELTQLENRDKDSTDPDGENAIIDPINTTWVEQSTCAFEESTRFESGVTRFLGEMTPGESFTKCYFQEIPFGKQSGVYEGTLTIKVNSTN